MLQAGKWYILTGLLHFHFPLKEPENSGVLLWSLSLLASLAARRQICDLGLSSQAYQAVSF